MSAPTENPIRSAIEQAIADNDVILFMKGTPDAPRCGFSAKSVAVLEQLGTPFAAVDILPDPRIRQELSAISNWPTIPQLFHKGSLVGGCDIIVEMHETGELATELGLEAQSGETADPATPAVDASGMRPGQAPEGPPLTIENRLG